MGDSKTPVLTEAIQSYDGIFKGMYDEELRKKFLSTRQLLADGKIDEAITLVNNSLTLAKDDHPDKETFELIKSELGRYAKYHISEGSDIAVEVDYADVKTRRLERHSEKHWDVPQSIFFLTYSDGPEKHFIVGRKLLSDLWIQNKIPEIHCSFISADMILGVFSDQRITEDYIHVFYHPLQNSEKLRIFKDIMFHKYDNVELAFPFSLLRKSTRKELCSPAEGWVVDDAFDVMLGCGEERIRAYTIKFLETLDSKNLKLYDPACSTGVFLSTLKQAYPESRTVGQDLSKQMVGFAKSRVDEVHVGNAMEPKIDPGSADVVFIRFLNSEVVTSAEAAQLLEALLPTVKIGGHMVIFGHTPVLLSAANFSFLENFALKQSVGISSDRTGIFQYYVLQRQ